MVSQRRISPEEEVYIDNRINIIKSWIQKCPKKCAVSDIFEIVCLLWEDRKAAHHHKDINNNKFY
jgi:hypothetical protein